MIDIMIKIVQMNIITNIVAGLILFVVLKKFVDWQEEHRQSRNARAADKRIYALLRPYIAAGTFPPSEIFQTFITTVARECEAELSDLYSVKYYCEEFIRDIMENDFISQEEKTAYTALLKEQIHSYEEHPDRWTPDSSEDPAEEKRRDARFNNYINICIFLTSGIVMAVNIASGSNDLYESLAIFAVVFVILIIFAEMLIKRGYYRNIPGFLNLIRHRTNTRKEQWEEKRAEKEARKAAAERLQLQSQNEQLASELAALRSELARLKETMGHDIPAEPADMPAKPADIPAEPLSIPAEPADILAEPADIPAEPARKIAPVTPISDKTAPPGDSNESDIPPIIIPGPDDVA